MNSGSLGGHHSYSEGTHAPTDKQVSRTQDQRLMQIGSESGRHGQTNRLKCSRKGRISPGHIRTLSAIKLIQHMQTYLLKHESNSTTQAHTQIGSLETRIPFVTALSIHTSSQ